MRSYQTSLRYILISCLANFAVFNNAYCIELVAATTISATNSNYENQDLIVNGTTLTIDGSHQFSSVQLINGAILTHSLSASTRLEIITSTFFVDAGSRIDLTGKGHLPTSAVTGASGGSYGGLGGVYVTGGTTNPVFGNPTLPSDFGIGGIGSDGTTYGGGSIKLITDTLILDGDIIANGQGFNTFYRAQGGGSGGSIFLNAGTFNGVGTLQASGGSGFTYYGGGGGGGGRIAVYYESADFDFQNNVINEGGVCKPLFGDPGQPGTIYFEQISSVNQAPVAHAGNSLVVTEQSDVTLTGNATDVDGVIARYQWSQLSGPMVNLVNTNTATLNFTAPSVLSADSPTVLQFRLTVQDDQGASASADSSVGVLAINALPVADAGADFSADEATDVNLNGSAEDSDGTITAYRWTQISGTPVTLSNSTRASATFTAPALNTSEQLAFRLTVTDNESGSHSDVVLVTVSTVNTLPIANITGSDSVSEDTFTLLDGTASTDSDGSIVNYQWTQTEGPAVTLSNATSTSVSFTTPSVYQDTTLTFRLDIQDDDGGTASATMQITVLDVNTDDDIDGMQDTWEIWFFSTLEHDGNSDTDGDGASDIQEHDFGTDPTAEQPPAQPEISSPDNIEVTELSPELILTNPSQHAGFPVSYEFEIYRDAAMTDRVTSDTGAKLNWQSNTTLSDNNWYYWRARAAGSTLFSSWVSSKFFTNTRNDAPGAFNISYPQDGVWVTSFTPILSVTNSVDVDSDDLSYRFEIYADGYLVTASEDMPAGADGSTSWTVDVPLLENNAYIWRVVVTDEHGLNTLSSSEPMIFINTVNDAPAMPALSAPLDQSEISQLYANLLVNNVIDPEGDAVHYFFELDTSNTFDSANKQSSGAITETSPLTGWAVSELTDNTWYHWRVKASDGFAESAWSNGRFFVNQFNDAPTIPAVLNPGDHAWTGNLQPTLEVHAAIDIDGDALSYEFNVYSTAGDNNEPELIATGMSATTFWQLDLPLNDSGYYYWHARAVDEHGLAGDWGDRVVFFADSDGVNDTPIIKLKNLDYAQDDAQARVEISWMDYDPDSNARISLYYDTDQYGEDGVLIAQAILEDADGESERHLWDISQLADGVYFIYAVIDDGNTRSVDYSKNAIMVGDGGGHPFLSFKSFRVDNQGKRNQRALIDWRDVDSDSHAAIDLYYDTDNSGFDGVLIAGALEEEADGNGDHYLWDTSTQAEGSYYIYAIISDGSRSYRVYADNPVVIKHGAK